MPACSAATANVRRSSSSVASGRSERSTWSKSPTFMFACLSARRSGLGGVGRGRGPGLVIVFRNRRQLLEEGDYGPDFLIGHLDLAEARHAGHPDAVLDDPEQLLGQQIIDHVLEIG